MNKYHSEILGEIKRNAGKEDSKQKGWLKSYMGTDKIFYSLRSETKNKIVRGWIKKRADLSQREFEELLSSLYKGRSHEEFCFAGRLLEYLPKLRRGIDVNLVDKWLDNAKGWGEVDSMCQSNFTAEEILANWGKWKKLITKLVRDENVHKRRASLVLLVKAVRQSGDLRLAELAFRNISKLKKEKDILITKAISWLLRSLITNNKTAVEKYLRENVDLPKIAVRETRLKLLTGKKSSNNRKA